MQALRFLFPFAFSQITLEAMVASLKLTGFASWWRI
jgi:hypothetical protein